MAYSPSSDLLISLRGGDNAAPKSSGYRPSKELISSLSGAENNDQSLEEKKRAMYERLTSRPDALGIITSGLYGLGKGGANIAKLLTGGRAPGMPDIRAGKGSALAEGVGQYLPFGLAGGTGLLGSTAAAGSFGASQQEPGQQGLIDKSLGLKPGGRIRAALEDAILNMMTHGIGSKIHNAINPAKELPQIDFKNKANFAPGESEFTRNQFETPSFLKDENAPLSENISKELQKDIAGRRSIEQSGQELATHLNRSYTKVKGEHQARYDNIFNAPTKFESAHTGEPFKVKEIPIDNGQYSKKFSNSEFAEKNLQSKHDQLIDNPTIENYHKFQSELGSEIGYMKKQRSKGLLDDAGRSKLKEYVNMRDTLKSDMALEFKRIDPKLANAYDEVTQSYKENVIPYESDKNLKDIASGKIKNPTSAQITAIFKNPEEDINKVVSHLPQDAKNRIVHVGSGKAYDENLPNHLLSARKTLETKGLGSYINPHYEQAFKNLKSNVQMEKESLAMTERNSKLLESLKSEQIRAEKARIAAAKTREKIRKQSEKESSKIDKKTKKDLQAQYDSQIKQKEESALRKSKLIRTIIGGAGGAALVHGLGIKPETIAGSYLGKVALEIANSRKK